MKLVNNFKNLKIDHTLYLFYFLPVFFLIGRSLVDFAITYLGLSFFIINFLIRKDFKILQNKIFVASLFFWLVLVFVSLFSSNQSLSLLKSISYLRFILFFGASVLIINNKKFRVEIFYKTLMLSILLINFDIFIQYLFGYNFLGFEPVATSQFSYRYSGFFGEEYIAGGYIQRFLLILAIIILSDINKFYKKYYTEILILFSMIIILITGDRMALIAIFYSIFFIFIFFKNSRKHVLMIFVIFLSSAGLMMISDKGIHERLKSIQLQISAKKEGVYYNPHLNLIKQAMQVYKNNVIFGSGLKTFREVCSNNENIVIFEKKNLNKNFCSTHPHNYYFEILSETGTFGFVSFITYLLYILYKSAFTKKYKINNKLMFICICVFMFPISTTGSFFTNLNASFFWFIISLININFHKEKK